MQGEGTAQARGHRVSHGTPQAPSEPQREKQALLTAKRPSYLPEVNVIAVTQSHHAGRLRRRAGRTLD